MVLYSSFTGAGLTTSDCIFSTSWADKPTCTSSWPLPMKPRSFPFWFQLNVNPDKELTFSNAFVIGWIFSFNLISEAFCVKDPVRVAFWVSVNIRALTTALDACLV